VHASIRHWKISHIAVRPITRKINQLQGVSRMNIERRISQAAESGIGIKLGIGLAIITTLLLAGCGSGSTSVNDSVTNTTDLTITPMKGQFGEGTSVNVKRTKDGVVVATGKVGLAGSATVKVPTTEVGPFLIEAGVAGDTYFDESSGASAIVQQNTIALRALIPNASAAVGVTALTEMAVGQIEAHTGGIAGTKATDVIAANATIGSQFGVPNPLATPSVIGAGTTGAKLTGGNAADDYALKLAGIAKLTSGGDAIRALHDLRDDIKDGTLDGVKSGVVITTLNIPVPTTGQTYQDAMSAALNTQVTAATTAYATPGAAVPTVTMTVADLAALLDAAMQVGAATQAASAGTAMTTETLNTQIATTVETQVATLAVAGADATTIAAGTVAAVDNATASGTAIASAATSATNFLAAAATGVFQSNFQVNSLGTQLDWGRVDKMTLTPNGALYDYSNSSYQYNSGTATWTAISDNAAGAYWDLTPTSAGGWVDTSTSSVRFTIAADGTFTVENLLPGGSPLGSSWSMLITQEDLSGQPVDGCYFYDNTGTQQPCTVTPYNTAVYPVGAAGFRFSNQIQSGDMYSVDLINGGGAATDMNGVALTALPKLGDSFCVNSSGGSGLYRPAAGVAAGEPNYTQVWLGQVAGGCTAANITSAAAQAGGPFYLSSKATGNAAAPLVLSIYWAGVGCTNGCSDQIIAYIPTKGVFQGWFQPHGTRENGGSNVMTNRVAFDAMVAAARAVTGVTGMGAAVPTLP
jgi:hypothetical protein